MGVVSEDLRCGFGESCATTSGDASVLDGRDGGGALGRAEDLFAAATTTTTDARGDTLFVSTALLLSTGLSVDGGGGGAEVGRRGESEDLGDVMVSCWEGGRGSGEIDTSLVAVFAGVAAVTA